MTCANAAAATRITTVVGAVTAMVNANVSLASRDPIVASAPKAIMIIQLASRVNATPTGPRPMMSACLKMANVHANRISEAHFARNAPMVTSSIRNAHDANAMSQDRLAVPATRPLVSACVAPTTPISVATRALTAHTIIRIANIAIVITLAPCPMSAIRAMGRAYANLDLLVNDAIDAPIITLDSPIANLVIATWRDPVGPVAILTVANALAKWHLLGANVTNARLAITITRNV